MWSRLVANSVRTHSAHSALLNQHGRFMSTRRVPPAETLSALKDLLGDRLSTATSVLEQHGTDESYHAVAPPDAVAFAQSTEEVSEIVKICAATCTPVIPFDGRIIKTGSKTRKSSAGYDLTRLLIGSEGTLGIVTEAELRLFGIPEAEKTMICQFDSIQNAVDTCAAVMQMGIPVARMELMDENAVEAINKYAKLSTPVRPSLIIEHHGSPGEVEEQSAVVVEIANDFEAQDIELATSAEERKKLWSGRHAAWYATMSQMPGSRGLSTDVAVPFSKLTDIIVETQQDLKESGLFGTIVGHVGDGNFHVMLPFFQDNEELMQKVRAFSDRLVNRAFEYEGTCTGEHGIGNGKMNYLSKEHGDSVEVMHTIKKALDPKDIMNPGKIFYGKN
ncbi:hypothetical protein BBJ29_001995 [Phytophthora kernoviae]|uniref:D-lactate dehydrogenase (cytochrome) n=1 Tax=Phytophthora kernoviae TaxID=325452 RepID=A0A3F2S5H8_9STRA|nr:hypothetical protein BBJ29_001995 [Phytophthora kernoviae]RLN69941.1 hypothetical protein BBP00_00000014 [Phytophthora kernoviae]